MTTPIIGSLPAQIAAGQLVSAGPVMANLNYIVSQVNANALPATSAPSLSRVFVKTGGGSTSLSSGTPLLIGLTAQTPTVVIDTLGEFNTATALFTATKAGLYQIMVYAEGHPNGGTYSFAAQTLKALHNGSQIGIAARIMGPAVGTNNWNVTVFGLADLAIGDTLSANVTLTFTGGPMLYQLGQIEIIGLG